MTAIARRNFAFTYIQGFVPVKFHPCDLSNRPLIENDFQERLSRGEEKQSTVSSIHVVNQQRLNERLRPLCLFAEKRTLHFFRTLLTLICT
jgi:hypothetical protein